MSGGGQIDGNYVHVQNQSPVVKCIERTQCLTIAFISSKAATALKVCLWLSNVRPMELSRKKQSSQLMAA
jgi:hypothetical protein